MRTAPHLQVMTAARHRWLDRLGAAGSLLCAAHCAALPLVIALLPSLGFATSGQDGWELAFVLFATAVGLFTLLWGWRRHGHVHALRMLFPGLALLWLGVLYEPLHHALLPHAIVMTIGGALVGVAHLANLRLSAGEHAHCAH